MDKGGMIECELSEYVESTAITGIEHFVLDSQHYYLFNEYNRFEIQILEKDLVKLQCLFKQKPLSSSAAYIQVKCIELMDYTLIYALVDDGTVEIFKYSFMQLESINKIAFVCPNNEYLLPSYLRIIDNSLLILAGLKGKVLLKSLRDSIRPSFEILFEGVLTEILLADIDERRYLFIVLQNDLIEQSIVQMYRIENEIEAVMVDVFDLPPGFSAVTNLVHLSEYILLVSECQGVLLLVNEIGLELKNMFDIIVQPATSYALPQAIISNVTKSFCTENGHKFYATTNYGEIFCFNHDKGKFVISPCFGCDQDLRISSLHFNPDLGILLCSGEGLDGCIFKISQDTSLESVRLISNWSPIVDLDSTTKKLGLILATAGNPMNCSTINQVRHGIKNSIIFQSDPVFRGIRHLWPLKRYKSDTFHSFVAVSFPSSTSLFAMNGLELELVPGCGLVYSSPTICIANSESSSFWIQACPDKVLAVKICGPDDLNAPVSNVWSPIPFMIAVAAQVVKNHVFILDNANHCIRIVNINCSMAKGTADIQEVLTIPYDDGITEGCSIVAFYTSPSTVVTDFLLAVAYSEKIVIRRIDTALGNVTILSSITETYNTNSLAFWKKQEKIYLGVGHRNGQTSVYLLDEHTPIHLITHHIGNAPVRTTMVKHDNGDQSLCCTSRGVWYMAHNEDGTVYPEKFHPHVECFSEVYLDIKPMQKTFIVSKKDSIAIIGADLIPSSWLYKLFSSQDLRRVVLCHDGLSLVSSVSTTATSYGSQNLLELCVISDLESVLRTKIPAHITSIIRLSRPGYFAVASIDSGSQGSLHIYNSQSAQERTMKRRSSISDVKKQPTSFSFVAASSGFASGISALCEVKDGIILISCDTDIYLLNLNYEEPSLQIFRSEPRRSHAYHLSSRVLDCGRSLVAIYDEDGVEIIEIDTDASQVFKHLKGDTTSRSGGKVHWLNDKYLVVSEKQGTISIIDTDPVDSVWLVTVKSFNFPDLPYSMCSNPERPQNILIGTMLGAIYELTCQF